MSNPQNMHGGGYVPGGGSAGYSEYDNGVQMTTVHSQPSLAENGKVAVYATDVEEYNDTAQTQSKKHVSLQGYFHIFESNTVWRWKRAPHWYQRQGASYQKGTLYRHRDGMTRNYQGELEDLYVHPISGKLRKLVVQATDEIYDLPANATWRRTFVRNVGPWYLRVAGWPMDHWEHKPENTGMVVLKWIPTSLALMFLLSSSFGDEGVIRNGGRFDAFPYKYYGYSKVSRNYLEDPSTQGRADTAHEINHIARRLLRPRYLCFLKSPESPEMYGVQPMLVEEWITQYRSERNLEYLFVAYTAEQFSHNSQEDMESLHHIAEKAARDAGLPAYWIGCSCMPEMAKVHEDVYRISDVIRGARSMVIAVGPPVNRDPSIATADEMVKQWGQRIWTFPEVLLSPKGQPIKVYARGTDLSRPLQLYKNQFASRVWEDSSVSRQLIDHYEGNLILSRLELVTLALQCLHKRQTTEYLPGDHSYALMGLLRLRPTVDPTDSQFQAFSRLSLANDSDKLIERLLCILPKTPDQPWYSFDDAYGASSWEIYPSCQVAGVGHEDTVVIDGAFAANVHWEGFAPVKNLRRVSWKRFFARLVLHTTGYFAFLGFLIIGISAGSGGGSSYSSYGYSYSSGGSNSAGVAIGVLFLIWAIIIAFLAPWLIKILYGGKFWYTQPWFFAFEGHLDIGAIEYQIFGANFGRLAWTPYGSPLSRHEKNSFGECVGVDPCTDAGTKALVERAKHAKPGEQRIFTLVDTSTMKVTLFQAARPPVMFMLCGSEGGMQRAIGCSYDWTSSTLYRETVLRMETPALRKMDRLPRARFGFTRPNPSTTSAVH